MHGANGCCQRVSPWSNRTQWLISDCCSACLARSICASDLTNTPSSRGWKPSPWSLASHLAITFNFLPLFRGLQLQAPAHWKQKRYCAGFLYSRLRRRQLSACRRIWWESDNLCAGYVIGLAISLTSANHEKGWKIRCPKSPAKKDC